MLYSLQENWSSVTRLALVSMLPVPQCYYVPSRIRGSYKARLEASELWHVPEVEDEPEEPRSVLGRRKKQRADDKPHKYKSVLEREKVGWLSNWRRHVAYPRQVVEKTRSFFDVYDRLLGEQTFFMGGQT